LVKVDILSEKQVTATDKGFTENFTLFKKEFGLREALMNFELEHEERSYNENLSENSN